MSTNQDQLSMQLASIDLFASPFIWPGFPLVGKGNGGISSTTGKTGLSPHVPPTVLPKKCWFCNFRAVFDHFPQIISPHKSTPFGQPCWLCSISVPLPPKKLKTYVYHWINPIPYNDRTFSKIYVTYFKLSTLAACAVLELPPSTF